MKTVNRSRLRFYLGVKYYRLKRYWNWYLGPTKYAIMRESSKLSQVHFTHQTPLLRQLKDVDMWLQHNKIINLRIAASKLNRVVIRPGETLSYWRLIGKPTRRTGYVEGMVLSHGQVGRGVGGGLCQLSNLIYWMTLHTPLTVIERYRHGYDVFPDSNRKQPFGSGATCYYNYLDLQIKNETSEPYQLMLDVTDTHLAGEWRAANPPTRRYEVYESEHWMTPEFWGGYMRHNKLNRRVYTLDNELIDDEPVSENHAMMMYEPFLAEKN